MIIDLFLVILLALVPIFVLYASKDMQNAIAKHVIPILILYAKNALRDLIYPVGSIYLSVNSANPSTFFGGTWEAWGSGRVPVGIDVSYFRHNTVEKTGGEKTHKLTVDEMPSHTHDIIGGCCSSVTAVPSGACVPGLYSSYLGNCIRSTGGNGSHNNLQPYITCYMWKRTA
jgi:hypothetical protein